MTWPEGCASFSSLEAMRKSWAAFKGFHSLLSFIIHFFWGMYSSIIHPFGSIHPCVQTSIHKVISSFQIFILILYQSTNPSTQGGLRVADLSGQLSAGGQDVVQDAQDHQGKSTSAYHQPINPPTHPSLNSGCIWFLLLLLMQMTMAIGMTLKTTISRKMMAIQSQISVFSSQKKCYVKSPSWWFL